MLRFLQRLHPRRTAAPADVPPLSDEGSRRPRGGRRGGPRTPLPLLPVIAVCAGIGIAYVSQTAHATQGTYEATGLAADQATLRQDNARLGDELGRLSSAERIVAAAQALGMRPAGQWAYVAGQQVAVVSPPTQNAQLAGNAPTSPVQQFVGVISGAYGGGR